MSRRKELGRRVRRELRTLTAMFRIYCDNVHAGRVEDCPHCAALLTYATHRLERCPFGEEKSTCANCTIHCYKPDMRDQIKEVMRLAGPRMTLRHPILAVHHLLDGLRKPPELGKPPRPDDGAANPS